MTKVLKILVIGKSGRLDAIATALYRSSRDKELIILSEVCNPGLLAKAKVTLGKTDDRRVRELACEIRPDFAVIGPEEPLAAGVGLPTGIGNTLCWAKPGSRAHSSPASACSPNVLEQTFAIE